jgi:flavin-dependent dehydrogenase
VKQFHLFKSYYLLLLLDENNFSSKGFKKTTTQESNVEKLVVGAGPVGLYLSSISTDTNVYDQKKHIGKPVQCTGLLTAQAQKLLGTQLLQKITLNTSTSTTIIGPRATATFTLSPNYIIDNSLFEELLYDKALAKGNNLHLQEQYLQSTAKGHEFRNLHTKKRHLIPCSKLVGADGPTSKVRQQHGFAPLQQYIGMQARVRVAEHQNANSILFYPHIGQYAWYVPETEHTARIGLVHQKASPNMLNDFLKRFSGRVIERQGGAIPLHNPLHATSKKQGTHQVSLLGDAGGHIKNTTGGGLVPGMQAAQGYQQKQSNQKGTMRALRKELYTHFLVHNLLKHATKNEWDAIIATADKHAQLLAQHDRDEARKLIYKLSTNKTLVGYSLKKILQGKVRII